MKDSIPELGSNILSLNTSGSQSRTVLGGDLSKNIVLHSGHNIHSYKGIKEVLNDWTGVRASENSLLALGLGQLSNASDTNNMNSNTVSVITPLKETNKKSVVDLELGFQSHVGSWSGFGHKSYVGARKCSDSESVFDLQLNLSTGPSESAITNVSPVSDCHDSLEASVTTSRLSFNDEGTSSSCWIFGSYLGPISTSMDTGSGTSLNKNVCTKPDPIGGSDFPPTTELKGKSSVACTSGFSCLEQRKSSTKKCLFQGCVKGARGASGLCIAHGGGRRCQKPGCEKGAEGRTIYCKAHGGGRRCEHLGCTKSAEGRTDFCIAHGGGRRCSREGCNHAARGKSGLCIKHGGGKRCQLENCSKSAEGLSGLCISHGGGRRCQFLGCVKGAQGSTMLCKAHGGGKRCTFLGCTKGAEGSTSFCKGHGGGKRCSFQGGGVCPKSVHGGTQFCVAHGGGKRCAVAECTKSARGRTNFCVRHGGGKRCKYEGCEKSAQGSTDFCKAHGGGKRCTWGQVSSQFGDGEPPCEKYARSKSGLCSSHNALLQDHCVHGGATVSASLQNLPIKPEDVKDAGGHFLSVLDNDGNAFIDCSGFDSERMVHSLNASQSGLDSLLEGRVHGGSLMAILSGNSADASNTDVVASGSIMHRWM